MQLGATRPWERMLGGSSKGVRLALISFLSLYFELTLIRWIPTQVRLLAYFTNFVLIAALLGLGVGMLIARRQVRLINYFGPALVAVTVLVLLLERYKFVMPLVSENQFIWNYITALPVTGVLAYAIMVGFFLVMAGVFVLVGQEVGRALEGFRPLAAYSINILGSVLGVVGFGLISYLSVPPALWFAVGAFGLAAYLILGSAPRWPLLVSLLSLVAVVAVVHADANSHPEGVSRHWSPYYEIETSPMMLRQQPVGYNISVNKDSHQQALDLSDRYNGEWLIAGRQRLYNLPYTLVKPKKVLVVGAGTGNDVAAALRMAPGATVDAVEIDPVIADLGRKLHPERPYDNPNVRIHIDDARSFLQKNDEKYDVIAFGFLDSHRLFSQMSSVRMDNYVYTQQNFESVRRHLAPGGIVAVTFTVHEKWIADRILTVMEQVWGRAPLVYQGDAAAWGTTLLVGPNNLRAPEGARSIDRRTLESEVLGQGPRRTWRYTGAEGFIDPSVFSDRSVLLTDEWPYLYMRERGVPPNYLLMLGLTVVASLALIGLMVPRINFRRTSNWNFLLLGAAFAMLEVRGITEVALVFGSTWITNSIVITAILLMILLANLVVSRTRDVPLRLVYLALFAVLLFDYFVSLRGLLGLNFWLQLLAVGLQVAGPMFFSGIIFARWFEQAEDTSSALGANLMGAVLGALLEYGSLVVGLRQLYLVALLFYLLSFALTFGGVSLRRAPVAEPAA